jgi:hypothetical protein
VGSRKKGTALKGISDFDLVLRYSNDIHPDEATEILAVALRKDGGIRNRRVIHFGSYDIMLSNVSIELSWDQYFDNIKYTPGYFQEQLGLTLKTNTL